MALLSFSVLLLTLAVRSGSEIEHEVSESETGVQGSGATNGTGDATPQPPSFEGALSNGAGGCSVHAAGGVDFGSRITNGRAESDR